MKERASQRRRAPAADASTRAMPAPGRVTQTQHLAGGPGPRPSGFARPPVDETGVPNPYVMANVVIPTVLIRGPDLLDPIDADFARANEIFARAGVNLVRGKHLELTAKPSLLGKDGKVQIGSPRDGDEHDYALSEEERALIAHNREPGRITAYWVPGVRGASGANAYGQTIAHHWYPEVAADAASVIVSLATRRQSTFAHELGHALGNLEHVHADPDNLMARGHERNTGSAPDVARLDPVEAALVTATRADDLEGIDQLHPSQREALRGSYYAEWDGKGTRYTQPK